MSMFYTPFDFGAVGDGVSDDTTALQNSLNASSLQQPLYIPPSRFKYTKDLVWPLSDTLVFGANPVFYNAYGTSALVPHGCRALTMDGSLYSGGYTSRHTLRDLSFDLTNAADPTAGVYLNNVYTIHFDNVTFNNNTNSIPVAVLIQGSPSNDVSLDRCRIYAVSGTPGTVTALSLKSVFFKSYDLDIEGFSGSGGIAVATVASVYADFVSPYWENNKVSFCHRSLVGQVNISGGAILPASNSATVFSLGAPNFSASDVGIRYIAGVVPVTYTARGLTNIKIRNCSAGYSGAPFVGAGSDISGSDIFPVAPQGFGPRGATWGTPVVLPPSGTMGNNGAVTFGTALPTTLPNCWMYFPSGAIFAGSAAGVYYVQMSSTTAGTVFNNTLASGIPYNIASPTAFSTTGPGAFTQTTGSNISLMSITVRGGSMGPGGSLNIDLKFGRNNDANAVLISPFLGGTQIGEVFPTASTYIGYHQRLQNCGAQNLQTVPTVGNGYYTDETNSAGQFLTIDTSTDKVFEVRVNSPAATTTSIVWGGTLQTVYAT